MSAARAQPRTRSRLPYRLEELEHRGTARRVILALAWPVMAEMALATVTQIVDMAMVGRLGPAAIASIGLSLQPLFFALSLFMGLAVGTTALVARSVGAGKPEQAGEILRQSLYAGVLMAVALAAAAYHYAPQLLLLMGAEAEVVGLGTSYIRALVPGVVFMLTGAIVAAALRGAGDTRTPMRVNVFLNVFNVLGNYRLIFGHFGFPALGVMGAAIATSVARSAAGLILLGLCMSGRLRIRLTLRPFRIDLSIIRRVFRVGIPAALERVVMSLAQLFYVRVVAGLGTVVYAAHAISINAESISFMPAMGFATAATTLVGQSLGARRPEWAQRAVVECLKTAGVFMGCMGVLFGMWPHWLMRIYTNAPEVIAMGRITLRVIAFAQLPMAAAYVIAGALRGAGDTRAVLAITAIGAWVVRLSLTLALVMQARLGLLGAWIAMASDWCVRGVLCWIWYRRGAWMKTQV